MGAGGPEISDDRAGVPDWKVDDRFKDDVFTFVRVEYSDGRRAVRGRRGGGRVRRGILAGAGAATAGREVGGSISPTATSTSPTGSSSSPR